MKTNILRMYTTTCCFFKHRKSTTTNTIKISLFGLLTRFFSFSICSLSAFVRMLRCKRFSLIFWLVISAHSDGVEVEQFVRRWLIVWRAARRGCGRGWLTILHPSHRMSGSGRGLTGNQPTTDNGTVCAEIASRHLAGDLPANNGSRS